MDLDTSHGQLLCAALASAEFLVIDTETNGRSGADCEMTEVGAVLVGGGELHDRWSSLCRWRAVAGGRAPAAGGADARAGDGRPQRAV
jgi:DNA polymerase III epsilon subunit-like protein